MNLPFAGDVKPPADTVPLICPKSLSSSVDSVSFYMIHIKNFIAGPDVVSSSFSVVPDLYIFYYRFFGLDDFLRFHPSVWRVFFLPPLIPQPADRFQKSLRGGGAVREI